MTPQWLVLAACKFASNNVQTIEFGYYSRSTLWLPVVLPDMMSALLLNRLKKQQQRAWEVSRKQLLGASSVGGIHHLRRPGAKVS